MQKRSLISTLYCIFLLTITILLIGIIYRGNWLETDLHAVLPQDKSWTSLQQTADKQQEAQLNKQIIALIGGLEDKQTVLELTKKISKQWQHSGLFEQVNELYQPNIAQLQQEIALLSIATLPETIRQQLIHYPEQYFLDYAQRLANPFNYSILPLQQDWLGFAQFVVAPIQNNIQWDPNSGLVYVIENNKIWGVLQAKLTDINSISPPKNLLELMQSSEQVLQQENAYFLATGAMLFSAQAKQQAEQESQWLSIIGVSLTLILLLYVFHNWRVIYLFLPIVTGLLVGIVATILLFKQIHIFTLIIGTSLIGVLIDFPLHWLASSINQLQWQGDNAMKKLKFTFTISLCVTLLGYILLGFTSLPILQQTALFSSVALIIAICSTLWLLPPLFKHYVAKPNLKLQGCYKKVRSCFLFIFSTQLRKTKLTILALFLTAGLWQTQWQDNIRQWVNLSASLLQQAQQISHLTGVNFSSQYFLLIADNDEELLIKDQKLTQQLTAYQQQNEQIHFQSLSQWLMPAAQQKAFIQQLKQLSEKDYQILASLNIPLKAIQQYLDQLDENHLISLQTALNSMLGKSWQHLYLGEIAPHQVASLIKINSNTNLAMLANQQDIFWQDKPTHLTEIFQITRDQAAWLKLISLFLAGGLLTYLFGIRACGKMLMVPIGSILFTLALFGWLNLPISLFAMFGLLLVSAITVDYAVYMQTAKENLIGKQIAVALAALTGFISFGLLTFSATPVVSAFGLSVSIGIIFGAIFTFILWRKE